jgi:hypothetical protein
MNYYIQIVNATQIFIRNKLLIQKINFRYTFTPVDPNMVQEYYVNKVN